MAQKPTILIIGTLDTERDEILYLRCRILTFSNNSCSTKILDMDRTIQDAAASSSAVPEGEITPWRPPTAVLEDLTHGEYIKTTIQRCVLVVRRLVQSSSIQGIISAGGSSGTSLTTALMREALPVGSPKVVVSTMAGGDVKLFVEETDITMMYRVVDVAGVNSILKSILTSAAGAIVGMVNARAELGEQGEKEGVKDGKRIAITMFGVTSCVDAIRRILTSASPHGKEKYEIFVFHATGVGGLAMERLIREGRVDAVIDLTTTEVADELFGGLLAAIPKRLEAGAQMGIPIVISVGACDMVNFGPEDTVPEKHRERRLYEHNPAVTLMRTSKEENVEIGRFIAEKLLVNVKKSEAIKVLLPLRGVSMIDKEGQPFHHEQADAALFHTLQEGLKSSKIQVIILDNNIHDEAFAQAVVESIISELMAKS